MDSEIPAVTLQQDQNWTSAVGFCSRPYTIVKLTADILYLLYCFPVNIIVIVELLKRNYRKRKDKSSSSSGSPSELVLLHINFSSVSCCAGMLLNLLGQLKVCSVNDHILDALFGPDLSAVPLFFVAICVDCYLAVVHPVLYMSAKNLRHQPLMYTTPVWVYTFVIWLITTIYDFPYYHPISMLSFYFSLPAVLFFNISTLRALHSNRLRNGNQMLSPAKRKAFLVILLILVVMLFYYLPQVSFFTYRFSGPYDPERFTCLELPLVMILPTLCDFVAPLLFLYCVGKLDSICCSLKTCLDIIVFNYRM